MKKYPLYKPSGVEWLGEIPNEWNIISLKHLVKIKITDGPHETPVAVEDGIPFVSAEAVQKHTINFDSKWGYISLDDHLKYSKKCKPENGDIFIVKSGATTGKVAYVDTNIEFNIWSPLALVRANEKSVYSRYLFNYIVSPLFQEQVQFSWSFGTQQNIGMGVIQNLQIITPPLSEQHSIVRFLDYKTAQIDSFIANRQKQIELLKEQKAGIINKAVTKGINPNAKMKASGIEWIGDIPEHWKVSKVKFVSKVKGRIGFRGYTVNDLVEEGQGALTLGATHINKDGEIDLSKAVYISWDKYYESPEIMVEKEDILVVQRGSVGVVGIVNYDIGSATINPSLVVLKRIKMNRQLLFLQLRSKIVKEGITTIFNETAVPMLSQNQISNFNILLPPTLDEQQSIIDYIKSEVSIIDTLISKYQKQIDLMQEYRTSLISQAVTGKIDVRDWKPKK